MTYFTAIGLKVFILLLGTTNGIELEEPKTQDYTIVAKVLQNFFDTYNASLRGSRSFPNHAETKRLKNTIDKVILQKIDELKPYLQDYSTTPNEQDNIVDKNKVDEDNNVTLEGDEETTIIEFLPHKEIAKESLRIRESKADFKNNVKRYKKIRDHIKNTLMEESVSVKTQKLVIKTLDSMLAYIVRSQCPGNSEMSNNIYRETLRTGKNVLTKDLTKNWSEKWDAIRQKYSKIWNDHFPKQANPARKLFMFFEQIQDFLTQIVNDTDHISNNYKVVCKLVKSDENNVINFNNNDLLNLRSGTKNPEKVPRKCAAFKVCSEELENFMRHLYKKLNGTVVHAFKNYAAMYTSDIASDGSGEKEIVIAAIDKLGDEAKQKVKKAFKSETSTFDLDHDKNADENIKRLKSYVHIVTEKCLISIQKILNTSQMDSYLSPRLVKNLKDDLTASLNEDLDNLRTELKKEICRVFSSCNGIMIRRSFGEVATRRSQGSIDKNKVYVKLQLTLDNKLKSKLAKGDIGYLDYFWNENNARKSHKPDVTRTTYASKNYGRDMNVTRTTTQHILSTNASSHSETKSTGLNYRKYAAESDGSTEIL